MSPALPSSSFGPALASRFASPTLDIDPAYSVGLATSQLPYDPGFARRWLRDSKAKAKAIERLTGDVSDEDEDDVVEKLAKETEEIYRSCKEIIDFKRNIQRSLDQLLINPGSLVKTVAAIVELEGVKAALVKSAARLQREARYEETIRDSDALYERLDLSSHKRSPSIASGTLSDASVSTSVLMRETQADLSYDASESLMSSDSFTEISCQNCALVDVAAGFEPIQPSPDAPSGTFIRIALSTMTSAGRINRTADSQDRVAVVSTGQPADGTASTKSARSKSSRRQVEGRAASQDENRTGTLGGSA